VTRLLRARMALALIGLILFVYGVRIDDPTRSDDDRLRWIAIGFLGVSLLLRLWRRPRPPG